MRIAQRRARIRRRNNPWPLVLAIALAAVLVGVVLRNGGRF